MAKNEKTEKEMGMSYSENAKPRKPRKDKGLPKSKAKGGKMDGTLNLMGVPAPTPAATADSATTRAEGMEPQAPVNPSPRIMGILEDAYEEVRDTGSDDDFLTPKDLLARAAAEVDLRPEEISPHITTYLTDMFSNVSPANSDLVVATVAELLRSSIGKTDEQFDAAVSKAKAILDGETPASPTGRISRFEPELQRLRPAPGSLGDTVLTEMRKQRTDKIKSVMSGMDFSDAEMRVVGQRMGKTDTVTEVLKSQLAQILEVDPASPIPGKVGKFKRVTPGKFIKQVLKKEGIVIAIDSQHLERDLEYLLPYKPKSKAPKDVSVGDLLNMINVCYLQGHTDGPAVAYLAFPPSSEDMESLPVGIVRRMTSVAFDASEQMGRLIAKRLRQDRRIGAGHMVTVKLKKRR